MLMLRRVLSSLLLVVAFFAMSIPSAQAQRAELIAWHNVRISCFHMQGLVENLYRVNNVMQVYNNDRATWQSKNGCVSYRDQPTVTRDFLGWYDTGRFVVGIEVVRYQNIPDPPRDPNKRGLRITNTQNDGGLRPIVIERSDRFQFNPICRQVRTTLNGVTLFGNDGRGVLPECVPNAGYDRFGHAGL
jgi:hypothetical protein